MGSHSLHNAPRAFCLLELGKAVVLKTNIFTNLVLVNTDILKHKMSLVTPKVKHEITLQAGDPPQNGQIPREETTIV